MVTPSAIFLLVFAVVSFADNEKPLSRIAFGSCNDPSRSQEYWQKITELHPDIWIWGGDIVYADKMVFPLIFIEASEEGLHQRYSTLKHNKYYQEFLQTNVPVLGTWDDHDYGLNDGGIEVKIKEKSKQQILSFLDVPKDAQQWQHDERTQTDILGPEQWTWLEDELRNSDAQINLIMSGSEVLPVDALYRETWDPSSMVRLLSTIAETKASGVILLSGDVHYSEIFKNDCANLNYPLYEFTSSGLTHSAGDIPFGSALIEATFSKWHVTHQIGRNFGTIEISWDDEEPSVDLQSRSVETGAVVVNEKIHLRDIQYDATRERTNFGACFKQADLGVGEWKRTSKLSIILLAVAGVFLVGLALRAVVKCFAPNTKQPRVVGDVKKYA